MIVLYMLNFLWKVQDYLEIAVELICCLKLNVLFSYLGCKLYDHLLQIRFAKYKLKESFIISFLLVTDALKKNTKHPVHEQ